MKKFVKVCFHSNIAMQNFLQFDESFILNLKSFSDKKIQSLISRRIKKDQMSFQFDEFFRFFFFKNVAANLANFCGDKVLLKIIDKLFFNVDCQVP